MPRPRAVSALAARRFARRLLALDTPHPDIATALTHHGYIQIDPINVCGRMHDLILSNRVRGYLEGGLMRHLRGEEASPLPASARTAFEHHVPATAILVAFQLEAWPHLLGAMHAHPPHRRLVRPAHAPRTRTRAKPPRQTRGPWPARLRKTPRRTMRSPRQGCRHACEIHAAKTLFHCRILMAHREANRRLYDRPKCVLPAATLAVPEPDAA